MKKQDIKNQKGEIEFRKKVAELQCEGKKVIEDEYDSGSIIKVLQERMTRTFEDISYLKQMGYFNLPYLEIGAERCQRSLKIENDLNANGIAVDISYHSLKSCEYYSNQFNKKKLPLRICCDAYNLPFSSNSIPFAFCYQTLHHFPDPDPIIKEIHRVLSNGACFFIGEEPYKKILHYNLYKKKMYSNKSIKSNKIRKVFDYFFADQICNEIEFGIIENQDIPLISWKNIFSQFDEKQIKIKSLKIFKTELFSPTNIIFYFFAYLFGGSITGICRKSGSPDKMRINPEDLMICPECLNDGHEVKILKSKDSYFCKKCKNSFSIIDGIVFLLTNKKFQELYPDLYASIHKGISKK